jgi:hypothetical protein
MADVDDKNVPRDGISTPQKETDSSSLKTERLEQAPGADDYLDPAAERSVLRKMDRRIIPMVMWVYLMNMMDRGKHLDVLP